MPKELLTALALVLVLEGIAPFVSPSGLRKMMAQMAELDDRILRLIGVVSMLAGVVLLYLVRRS